MNKSHRAKDCTRTKPCRNCNGRHHNSICSKTETAPNPASVSDATSAENVTHASSASTATSRNKNQVLLQTARTMAFGGDDSRAVPVRILFDTGSQRSYITDELQKQLKLEPLDSETLHLNTFVGFRNRCDQKRHCSS